MTDEVGELVLDDNRAQTLALSIARKQTLSMANVHARYLDLLEAEGWLGRGDPWPPVAPGDRRHPDRQPDDQPVGHLLRPPDDGGHRRRRRRRDPGMAGVARHLRLRRTVERDRAARPGRQARCPAGPVPRAAPDDRARHAVAAAPP